MPRTSAQNARIHRARVYRLRVRLWLELDEVGNRLVPWLEGARIGAGLVDGLKRGIGKYGHIGLRSTGGHVLSTLRATDFYAVQTSHFASLLHRLLEASAAACSMATTGGKQTSLFRRDIEGYGVGILSIGIPYGPPDCPL